MSCEIRLDRWAHVGNDGSGSSYSTVKIATHDHREINWGNANHRGETSPIVTVKLSNLLSVTVDDEVVGKAKLKALHHRYVFQIVDEAKEAAERERTSSKDRIDAATAAIAAGDYKLACDIEASVLFDDVTLAVLNHLGGRLTLQHLAKFMQAAKAAMKAAKRRGRAETKAELRQWLGGD